MSKIDREPNLSYIYHVNLRSKKVHRWVTDGVRLYPQEQCNRDDTEELEQVEETAALALILEGYTECGHDWPDGE